MSKKKLGIFIAIVLVVAAIAGVLVYMVNDSTTAGKISIDEAQAFVNEEFDKMATTDPATLVAEKNNITVNSVSYGSEKDIILNCTADTISLYDAVNPNIDSFLSAKSLKEKIKMEKSALDFKLEFEKKLTGLVSTAGECSVDFQVRLYETDSGLKLYATDEATNAVYGNLIKLCNEVKGAKKFKIIDENGNETEKEIESPNVNKGFIQCLELKRNTEKPDTSNYIGRLWNGFKEDFDKNFIKHNRYKEILKGLWTTIKLTVFALLIGIFIGFIVAFVRCTYLKKSKRSLILRFFNSICQIYLTVIRGTPVVVQIMIIYFVIFMPMGVDKFIAAVICFGLNSGAYVAEIVRGGIMSVDDGQTEAGRSLGFGYMATMYHIVFPQAFKAVLPALANELVVLLKETSIAFYIGLGDLMYAGNSIRAATYSAFMPLVAVALIYLGMVLLLSKLVGILERRLRNNER